MPLDGSGHSSASESCRINILAARKLIQSAEYAGDLEAIAFWSGYRHGKHDPAYRHGRDLGRREFSYEFPGGGGMRAGS